MTLKKIVHDAVTESDGESFDPIAIMCIITTIFVLAVVGHSYFVKGKEFNITDFGFGVAALWAGAAGGSRLRPQVPYRPHYQQDNSRNDGANRRTEDLEP